MLHRTENATQLDAPVRVTLEEHRKADSWDPNRTAEVEDARLCSLVRRKLRDHYRNLRHPTRRENDVLLRTLVTQCYESVRREPTEDPELVHAATQHVLAHERPSRALMAAFTVVLYLLIAAEVGVAALQFVFSDASFAVILMGVLLTVGGVLAGKGLARWVHAAWIPGPGMQHLAERIRWPGSVIDDAAKLLIGLLLIGGIGAIRTIGSGLDESIVITVVTVGLALAIAVVEAVLTEWKFRYAKLHELQFEASEILAANRHRESLSRAQDDVVHISRDDDAIPASSWIAAAQQTMLEQEHHRLAGFQAVAGPAQSDLPARTAQDAGQLLPRTRVDYRSGPDGTV